MLRTPLFGTWMPIPKWLNETEYPFQSHYLELDMGRMHYVDEGRGDVIVMVHGNPYWSFMYRKQIEELSKSHRCIAMDHIGFGLSDKPHDWTYYPEQHADNLQKLIEHLGLKNIILVVHDWGGPIGLSHAVAYPDNVRKLIITNTWMWSMKDNPQAVLFSRFFGGPIGRNLIRHTNLMVRLLPKAFGDQDKFKRSKPYFANPFASPSERRGAWTFTKRILESSVWLENLWSRRANIADKETLLVWGMSDPVFRKEALQRWMGFLKNVKLVKQPGVGHFVAEEMGRDLGTLISNFLQDKPLAISAPETRSP